MIQGRYCQQAAWRDEQADPSGVLTVVAHPAADAEVLTLEQAYAQLRLTPTGSPPSHADDAWLTDFGIGAAREACEQEVGLAFVPQTYEYRVRAFPTTRGPRPLNGVRAGLRLPMAAPLRSIESIAYRAEDTVTDAALDDGLIIGSELDLPVTGTLVGSISGLSIVDSAGAPLALVVDTDYTVDLTTGHVIMLAVPGAQPYLTSFSYVADRALDASAYQIDDAVMPAVIYPAVTGTWPATQTGIPRAVTVRFIAGFDLPGASPITKPLPYRAAAAVRLMLGHLYENREATTTGTAAAQVVELPMGVRNMLRLLTVDLGMA